MSTRRMRTPERLRSIESSMHARWRRLRKRAVSILQIAVAAATAFWVAQSLFGHEVPFFAPIAVIIVVGLTGGERVQRGLEMSFGCVLGVFVGDLLFLGLGTDPWQIGIMVALAMGVASLFSKSPLVANQVAIGTVLIATIMPPGAETTGIDRTLDAIAGSAVGLLTVALIPTAALSGVRQEVANVMSLASSVLNDVADGLENHDEKLIFEALSEVRGSQASINTMLTAAKSGRESVRISPLMWGRRRTYRSIDRILTPVDNCVRSTRVLARRAWVLARDNDYATPLQVNIIDELAEIMLDLANLFEAGSELHQHEEIPDLVARLRLLGARSDMSVVGDDPVLSNYAVLSQSRALVVDLLQICGMSYESAVAVLTPTSSTPAVPPEVWNVDGA